MAAQLDPNDPANGGWGAAAPASSVGQGASATTDPWEQAKNTLDPSVTAPVAPSATPPPAAAPTSSPAAPADYSAALGQAPVAAAPAPTSTAPSAGTSKYAPQLQAISSATDPSAKAIAQDTLARQVYTDLQAAGHQVEWDGSQLVVDGRPYDIGDGSSLAGLASPTQAPTADAGTNMTSTLAPQYQFGAAYNPFTDPSGNNAAPPGFDLAKWADPSNSSYSDPKYTAGHIIAMGGTIQDVVAAIPGAKVLPGSKDVVVMPDGSEFDAINSVNDSTGTGGAQWLEVAGPGGAPVAGASGAPTDTSGGLASWLAQMGGGSSATAAPTYQPASSTAPTYTPGTFSDPTLKGTTDLVNNLTANPDSLSPQTIAEMKAKAAETASVAGQAQDQDLAHFGGGNNLTDSPWLASARADNAWNTRNSVLQSNQNIDISSAEQNKSDERAAAQLGMSADQLAQARFQLDESVKQQATALGLTKDQMLNQMIIAQMSDATTRHGIDLGFTVDEQKLSEQSTEFKQNMLLQLQQLTQQNQQFGANYGLNVAAQNEKNAQDAWNNAKDLFGSTGATA